MKNHFPKTQLNSGGSNTMIIDALTVAPIINHLTDTMVLALISMTYSIKAKIT